MLKLNCIVILFFVTFSLIHCEEKKQAKEIDSNEDDKLNEIELEDEPVPSPRCLKRFSNTNCTQEQRTQGIAAYRASRNQLIQQILSGSTNKNTSTITGSNSTLSPSSQVSNNTSTTLIGQGTSLPSNSACNRATQTLADFDRYARFDSTCQVRVFGRKRNPDYWIERCKRTLDQ